MAECREYTSQTRRTYEAPRCPECSRLTFTWADVIMAEDEGKKWVPSDFRCPGSNCPNHEPSLAGIPGL